MFNTLVLIGQKSQKSIKKVIGPQTVCTPAKNKTVFVKMGIFTVKDHAVKTAVRLFVEMDQTLKMQSMPSTRLTRILFLTPIKWRVITDILGRIPL